MKKWLKRHFIPHEGNGHRPHFLLRHNAIQFVWAILLFELVLFVLPTLNFAEYARNLNLTSVLPGVLTTLTNEERLSNDLLPLSVNPMLARAAQLKAEDMAAKGYFAHTSPEGVTPWYWLGLVGYSYAYAGENLAVNFSDSEEVTDAWMNSPTHRANIVAGAYTEVGTGIATGVYKGRETVFVAQLYGRPAVIVATAPQSNSPVLTRQNPTGSDADENLPASPTLSLQNAQPEEVLGEAVAEAETPTQSPNFFQRLLTTPRESANAVLYVSLALILIALFLNIVIKFRFQFPDLITNGVVVVVIVLGLHLANGYIAENSFETSFTDFAPQNELSLGCYNPSKCLEAASRSTNHS